VILLSYLLFRFTSNLTAIDREPARQHPTAYIHAGAGREFVPLHATTQQKQATTNNASIVQNGEMIK
jgi:hypothetical protein